MMEEKNKQRPVMIRRQAELGDEDGRSRIPSATKTKTKTNDPQIRTPSGSIARTALVPSAILSFGTMAPLAPATSTKRLHGRPRLSFPTATEEGGGYKRVVLDSKKRKSETKREKHNKNGCTVGRSFSFLPPTPFPYSPLLKGYIHIYMHTYLCIHL